MAVLKPGDAVTVTPSGLRPRMTWAHSRSGVVLAVNGDRVVVRVLAANGRYRPVTLTAGNVGSYAPPVNRGLALNGHAPTVRGPFVPPIQALTLTGLAPTVV